VQAGASWRDVQAAIDPHGLAVRTMQSFANFSVGGSVSVNCHGRYVGHGAIAHSVLALQLVTAAGDVLELSRERDAELFHAVFGSYGALGVVTEVELALDANTRITRVVQRVPLHDYPAWFAQQVLANPKALLHNADLSPPDFAQPLAITWVETTAAPTEPARLVPPGAAYRYWGERAALWAMTELPAAGKLREHVINPVRLAGNPVVWRNHECSLDTAMLGANDSVFSTYLLQEYFVPVPQFLRFALAMQQVLTAHGVNAVNVSIRHAPADHSSLLSWAREADVFAFVLYYKQRKGARADAAERAWTRQLISAALACGGCHYLPYRLLATREQVLAGYPQLPRFARIKRALDPQSRMRNALWDAYLPKTD
jgi:FAD/FMN-containing dehydrogenase